MSRSDSSPIRLAALLLGLSLAAGCGTGPPEPSEPGRETSGRDVLAPEADESPMTSSVGDATAASETFSERAAQAGLDFVHFNGMTGELYYSEVMAGGAALFDYDQDGDLDLYLTQGHLLGPGKSVEDARFPPRHPLPLSDRLYRNEMAPEGQLRFTDVTIESSVAALGQGYGMGVAVGDVDNDGWPDLYLTQWGASNRLLRNQGASAGGGAVTFRDVTESAGVGERRWSVAAAFFDYDRDGWLDLFVGNYLDFSFAVHKECSNDLGLREYCGPASFEPQSNVLFRNRGDGTFEDVTGKAGVTQAPAPTLGAVSGDFNGDGWLDLYVANDEFPNNLLLNQGGEGFVDDALVAGCAMNAEGIAEAGMGVDAGDFDNDGDEDLFVAHLNQETNTLYTNDATGIFDDDTVMAGLGAASYDFTGFGAGFFDYDNDGRLDLLIANGAVRGIRALMLENDPYPLHQRNQLFRNQGDGTFAEVGDRAGAAFELSEVSRGAAFGDLDNDGDIDVLIHNNAGPARLLVNDAGNRRPWLGLRLVGRPDPAGGERDMLGAWVELLRPGRDRPGRDGASRGLRVRTEGSYACARDPRVIFGLGDEESADPARIRVTWPDGSVEEWSDLPAGRYTTLRQGSGTLVP